MSPRRRPADRAAQLSATLAVAAATAIAILINVLAARHYERWDWTRDGRYTLDAATARLLETIQEPIAIHVLTSEADPLTVSVRHLLTAFEAHTGRLEAHFVDPDRDAAAYLAVQKRYGLLTADVGSGAPEAEPAIVVARGSRHHVVPYRQLAHSAAGAPDDAPSAPRLETILASALRAVLASSAATICFTIGHDEDALEDYGPHGLGVLADRLRANNFEAIEVRPERQLEGQDPLGRCLVTIIAGPKQPFDPADVARLERYLRGGGSVLIAAGPVPDQAADRMVDLGLAELLRVGGMRAVDDIVFELEPARRAAHGLGESFFAQAREHGATFALPRDDRTGGADVYLEVSGVVDEAERAVTASVPLLVSSDRAFAMRDFFAWARAPKSPQPSARDRRGPLVLARAAELASASLADGKRPRMVVVATSSILHGASWQLPELRPTALFVQGVMGWLAADPVGLAPTPAAPSPISPKLTEQALSAALRYALVYVPLGIVLLGTAVAIRRRSRPGARASGRALATRGDGERGRASPSAEPSPSDASSDEETPHTSTEEPQARGDQAPADRREGDA